MNDKWQILLQPSRLIAAFMARYCTWLPEDVFLRCRYRLLMHKKLHLNNPVTFTEKIQWLKLHDRKPTYTKMADKYDVKEYVALRIGGQYVIPTLGIWERFEDIDFSQLPDQFVLKSTNGGGSTGVVICKDKSKLDKEAARHMLISSLKNPASKMQGEWVYDGIKPRLIAEKFMAPEKNPAPADLPDYKFFCFNGEPKYCQVIRDRHSNETIDFYDMEWNHQDFMGLNPNIRNGVVPVEHPKSLDEMKNICRELAKGTPFVRIDIYVIDDKVYFGELTFYPNSSYGEFNPKECNGRLEDLLTLSNLIGGGKYLIDNGVVKKYQPEYDELKDYKFFCFNGKVKFFKIDFGRFTEHHANYYSPNGIIMPFGEAVCPPKPEAQVRIPSNLQEMIKLAEKLAINIPFVRIDLYNIDTKILFGEITFYPNSGFGQFIPSEWNEKLGDLIGLHTNCN